ncbi:MAG: hypothetical protein QM762_13945 [Chryseolinea sp.]
MKKVIYSLLIAFAASMAFTACTEEEVAPTTVMNGGGVIIPEK